MLIFLDYSYILTDIRDSDRNILVIGETNGDPTKVRPVSLVNDGSIITIPIVSSGNEADMPVSISRTSP